VDIAHGLADSVVAFEARDFRRFGQDIGTALRKILLSNANSGTKGLPEGVPQQDVIQKVTEGVMRGFFVSGSGIVITDTAVPSVNIVLNLHQCIAGNSMFFKQMWMGIWDLFAQLSLNSQQHDLGSLLGGQNGQSQQPKWTGELMVALLQFPMALQRCGLGANTQSMIMDAVQSLKYVRIKAVFPDDQLRVMKATDRMARAVKAWTNWDFKTFGKEIGKLLRELVMLAFPQKYSIDNAGRLRQELLGYNEQLAGMTALRQPRPIFTVIVGGCALSILVALVAVRSIWSTSREFDDQAHFIGMQDDLCEMQRIDG
jgi:hypothetical protein